MSATAKQLEAAGIEKCEVKGHEQSIMRSVIGTPFSTCIEYVPTVHTPTSHKQGGYKIATHS